MSVATTTAVGALPPRLKRGFSMMRLADPVNLVLKQKGSEVWSIRPDQSVYEAIEKMAEKGLTKSTVQRLLFKYSEAIAT